MVSKNKQKQINKSIKVKKRRMKVITTREDGGLQWLRLLKDPCSADLTAPCYAGTDNGYLVRTTDNVNVICAGAGLVAGTVYQGSAFVTYSPAATSGVAFNPAYLAMGFAPGGTTTGTMRQSGFGPTEGIFPAVTNFINSSTSSVEKYRCVAACLKWVPSGPYASRQGVVGLGYSSGAITYNTAPLTYLNAHSLCQRYAGNGSEPHEVRWLPTIADERFRNDETSQSGGGTVCLSLLGVDVTATSATTAILNGYIEVTTVWEWTPIASNGLTMAPKIPKPETSQGVLSRITDLGSFLFAGMEQETKMGLFNAGKGVANRAISGASRYASQVLSRGVGSLGTRAIPMLLAA